MSAVFTTSKNWMMDGDTYDAICMYKQTGEYPKDLQEMVDKAAAKQKKRLFHKRCDWFVLNEGALFHMPTGKKPGAAREVPKACDIDRILRAFHEDSAGGCHSGVTATFNKISERYYWRGMYDAVLGKVNSCQECQRHNTIKKGPSQLHPVPVPDACFAQRGMDLVGPLNCTPSGNQYSVVFTEYLSRW